VQLGEHEISSQSTRNTSWKFATKNRYSRNLPPRLFQ
jgi:hypothetical protein